MVKEERGSQVDQGMGYGNGAGWTGRRIGGQEEDIGYCTGATIAMAHGPMQGKEDSRQSRGRRPRPSLAPAVAPTVNVLLVKFLSEVAILGRRPHQIHFSRDQAPGPPPAPTRPNNAHLLSTMVAGHQIRL